MTAGLQVNSILCAVFTLHNASIMDMHTFGAIRKGNATGKKKIEQKPWPSGCMQPLGSGTPGWFYWHMREFLCQNRQVVIRAISADSPSLASLSSGLPLIFRVVAWSMKSPLGKV